MHNGEGGHRSCSSSQVSIANFVNKQVLKFYYKSFLNAYLGNNLGKPSTGAKEKPEKA